MKSHACSKRRQDRHILQNDLCHSSKRTVVQGWIAFDIQYIQGRVYCINHVNFFPPKSSTFLEKKHSIQYPPQTFLLYVMAGLICCGAYCTSTNKQRKRERRKQYLSHFVRWWLELMQAKQKQFIYNQANLDWFQKVDFQRHIERNTPLFSVCWLRLVLTL